MTRRRAFIMMVGGAASVAWPIPSRGQSRTCRWAQEPGGKSAITRDYTDATQSFLIARLAGAKHDFKRSRQNPWCSGHDWEGSYDESSAHARIVNHCR